jgi:hypothetical protein
MRLLVDRVGGDSLIASAALTGAVVLPVIVSSSSALSADECLATPNSPSPPGSHWYYRLERPSQRKCWYLGPEGREVHATSSKRVAVAKTAAADVKAKPTVPTDSPSASLEAQSTNLSVSRKAAPSHDTSAADAQALSSRRIELPPMPPAPASNDPKPAASVVQKSVPAAAGSVVNEDVPNAPVVQVNSMVDAAQHETAVHNSAQVHDPDRKDDAKSATFSPVRALLSHPGSISIQRAFCFRRFSVGLAAADLRAAAGVRRGHHFTG